MPEWHDGEADPSGTVGRVLSAADERVGAASTLQILLAIALVALVARVVFLGARMAHFDEGRVAYWAVYYQETGTIKYRSIVHGPFVQYVTAWLFEVLPPTDFSMRLPVAVVGSLLPLTAYLFRKHLRRAEVVAMGLFLAANPVLLYYSRYMRSDVLVATFMFAALGFLVRYYDTRRHRYLYAATTVAALGFASKENAIVYILTWLGALGLIGAAWAGAKAMDLYGGVVSDPDEPTLSEYVADECRAYRTFAGRHRQWLLDRTIDYFFHIVFAAIAGGLVLLFFFAPRGAGVLDANNAGVIAGDELGLWEAVAQPLRFPEVIESARTDFETGYGDWLGKSGATGTSDNSLFEDYERFAAIVVQVLVTKAAPLTAFAVVGFVYEWSRSTRLRRVLSGLFGGVRDRVTADGGAATVTTPRAVVLLASYAGFASIVGYPLGMDIRAGWVATHAIVPLSIPAGVALARVYSWGREAYAERDDVAAGIATALVLTVFVFSAVVAGTSVYTNYQTHENPMVQFAQPSTDAHPTLQQMAGAAGDHDGGPDAVVYYGEHGDEFDDDSLVIRDLAAWENAGPDEPRLDRRPVCVSLTSASPLHWYLYKDDVETECERDQGDLEQRLASDPPPVVITQPTDQTVPRSQLHPDYEKTTHRFRSHATQKRPIEFWIHEDWQNAST